MRNLPEAAPSWVSGYIGIPFSDRGRNRRDGLDCWGLYRLVAAEQFGMYLPGLADRYAGVDDVDGLSSLVESERGPGGPGWDRLASVDAADIGDLLLARLINRWHVGMVVARGRMLHALAGTASCVERFDTPVWERRLEQAPGGVYRFAGPVRVAGRTMPIAGRQIDAYLPAGQTVRELIIAAGVALVDGLRAFIGGREVPFEAWDHVRPRPGRLLTIAVTPEGGNAGKTILRIVGTIAIIAAAAYLGPLLATSAYLGSQVGAALVVGALTIGATLALSALAPPASQGLSGADGSRPSIEGTRNELRPYQPCILPMGEIRVVPPYASFPFTEVVGDNQYLRTLFDVGYGPLEISDVKIGETAIEDLADVQLEVRSGFDNDEPIRLYPDTVHEDTLSILLQQVSSWQVRTTQTAVEEIQLDITFPTGLAVVEDDGSRSNRTVSVDVEYRPSTGGAWVQVNGNAGSTGSPTDARGLDLLTRTPEVAAGGVATHAARIAWGLGFADSKPGYLPTTRYSWVAEAWWRDPTCPENGGNYYFSVDCSDAGDLTIDDRPVASWYGSHSTSGTSSPNFTTHGGSAIYLGPGWHKIRFRVEVRSTTGAAAVGWKTPASPGAWAIMPASVFRTAPGESSGTAGFLVHWFNTEQYLSSIATTEARTDQVRRTLAWSVPAGQYDVRVKRSTADVTDPHILDKVYWTALRSIKHRDPIRLPNRAKIALRIRATDQLNGVIDQLNCMVRSVVLDWDSGAGVWVQRGTSNPASLYRAVLQGRGTKLSIPDSKIDLEELQAWHEDCVSKGLMFNGLFDFAGTVYEVLAAICAAGRASFTMKNGLFSVVRDVVHSTPAQHFTPVNSWGYRGRKAFADIPHALRVGYLDQDNGYQRAERVVLDDGYQIDDLDAWGASHPEYPPATRFETLDLFGIASADEAFKHGRYHLATMRLRPELHEINVDFEHLVCLRGDMVLLTHDVPKLGDGYGRIAAVITDGGGNVTGVRIDGEVTMDLTHTWRLRVRLDDMSTWARDVVAVDGAAHELTFAVPVPYGDPAPKVGDLFAFGEATYESREMVIKSIEPNPDMSAKLTLVDHAPAVHDADVGSIPAFDPGITGLPSHQLRPDTPVIEAIRSDDWVMVREGSELRPRIQISLRRPAGTRPFPSHAIVATRPLPDSLVPPVGPWVYQPPQEIVNNQVYVNGVEVGRRYQIRLRTATRTGLASDWVETEHTVAGNTFPPPDVQFFAVVRLANGTRLYEWDLGTYPPDVVGVLIRYGLSAPDPAWEDLTPLTDGPLPIATPYESSQPAAGAWRFGIKMIDSAGNESTNAVMVDVDIGDAPSVESLVTVDARALGWPGTKSSCHVAQSGPILEADDSSTWSSLTTWTAWTLWNNTPASPISYTHDPIDIGAVVDSVPTLTLGAFGPTTAEFRHSDDNVTWSSWVNYTTVAGQTVRARYHQWRVTTTAGVGFFDRVPQIVTLVMEARAPVADQYINDLNTSALVPPLRIGPGEIRLPIDQTRFDVIRAIGIGFNNSGAGWSYEVIDRDVNPGPLIRIYNADRELADTTIDAYIRGF